MPDFIEPQLALLVDEVPSEGWVHEIKFDGYRMQGRVSNGKCILRSRKGLDWTHRFPEIVKACEKLPDCIIDGEICGLDKHGLPSFSGLQQALSEKSTGALVFFVFDLLWLQREDQRPYALLSRKKLLEGLLKKLKTTRIRYVEHHTAHGATMFKSACDMKLEGIVSKKEDARYTSGRPGLWKKIKCRPRQELIICGWEMNEARFASLILGAHRGGKIHYVGTAGTGFNSKNLPPLLAKLKKLERGTTPIQVASPRKTSSVHFVEPEMVCEVAFETWTRSGKVRQASYKGLREDKSASEVIVEEVDEG
jgi:bifunctional non-homologous end joining protein LigD